MGVCAGVGVGVGDGSLLSCSFNLTSIMLQEDEDIYW